MRPEAMAVWDLLTLSSRLNPSGRLTVSECCMCSPAGDETVVCWSQSIDWGVKSRKKQAAHGGAWDEVGITRPRIDQLLTDRPWHLQRWRGERASEIDSQSWRGDAAWQLEFAFVFVSDAADDGDGGNAGDCQGCTTFPGTVPGLQHSWRNGATLTLTTPFLVRAGCVPERDVLSIFFVPVFWPLRPSHFVLKVF